MKKYILYTTTDSKELRRQVALFARDISRTKGRSEVQIDVVAKRIRSVDTRIDNDGDVKVSWEWIRERLPRGEYDGVIFHYTPYYRRRWDLTTRINGYRNASNRHYPEFCVCADVDTDAANGYETKKILLDDTEYTVTELLRILYHEHAHFDEDIDDYNTNILTQNSVHLMDYELKDIHRFHLLVDYRGQAIKDFIFKIASEVLRRVKMVV